VPAARHARVGGTTTAFALRVALVPPRDSAGTDGLDAPVRELARAVLRRGGVVDVLAPRTDPRLPNVQIVEGAVIRRLPLSAAHLPFGMARAVSRHVLFAPYDIVHAHTQEAVLAIGRTRDGPRRLVFTPHASVRRLLSGRYGLPTAWVLRRNAGIVCRAHAEAELLERLLPAPGDRVAVVRPGVDAAAIHAAPPIAFPWEIVLAGGPLERHGQLASTIAALAALDADVHLVAIGTGPARRSLAAFAADLQVRSRVHLLGVRPTAERYSWLRGARAVVALSGDPAFPVSLLEAVAAGTPIVASDVPIHRELASYVGDVGVRLIPPGSSPLLIADVIDAAARTTLTAPTVDALPSLADAAERIVDVYGGLIGGRPIVPAANGGGRRGSWTRSGRGDRTKVDLSGAA
jgi:glycosyltransferase involved in cell wall biosynthesis